jgi:hypothetical protein
MSMEKWRRARFSDKKHSSDKIHHNTIQGRTLPTIVVSPYRELYPDSRPAKDSTNYASAAPKVIDIACTRRKLDEKIQEQNKMIDYYKHLITDMEELRKAKVEKEMLVKEIKLLDDIPP